VAKRCFKVAESGVSLMSFEDMVASSQVEVDRQAASSSRMSTNRS